MSGTARWQLLGRFRPHAFHVPGRTAEQLRQQGGEDDGLGEALVGDGNGRTLYDGVPEVGGAGRKGVVDEDGLSAGTFTEERHLCGDEKKGFCQPCNKGRIVSVRSVIRRHASV